MSSFLTKAGLGLALGATALATASPAEAQRWYGRPYYHHNRGGDVAAGALVGGIAGLAIGAAIANNNRPRYVYEGYYDRPYRPYRPYYAPTYYPAYQPYYQPYRECWTERRFDRWGYPVAVRVCN